MLNIYVFIYKRDLEQRGSCVVQRGSSSVENNVGVVKHICFHIQKAPGPAWFLRGSAWFHHPDRDLRNCKTYMFSYTKLSWTGVVPAWFSVVPRTSCPGSCCVSAEKARYVRGRSHSGPYLLEACRKQAATSPQASHFFFHPWLVPAPP